MNKVKIGIIGLGTVGSGVYKSLQNFENIEIVKIAVKNINKPRSVKIAENIITDNPYDVVNNPEIDIVVELMGGVEPAWSYIKTALENKKHIVTANKELLAKKGEELFNLSEKNNCVVLYEAAIAGGIPIIMPIKTILAGNKISKVQAILNGTTNYILTKMDADGASYEDVLKEAQEIQEELNSSTRECMMKIQEYKSNILQLEQSVNEYQKNITQINDLISLFLLTDRK